MPVLDPKKAAERHAIAEAALLAVRLDGMAEDAAHARCNCSRCCGDGGGYERPQRSILSRLISGMTSERMANDAIDPNSSELPSTQYMKAKAQAVLVMDILDR